MRYTNPVLDDVLTVLRFEVPREANSASIDPLPARALHADLLDRFKSLSGNRGVTEGQPVTGSHDDKAEDDKTIEELLADLGPAEQWDVGRSEHDEVEQLLRAAGTALRDDPKLEQIPQSDDDAREPAPTAPSELPAVDVSVFQPEPESDDDGEPKRTKAQLHDTVNQEADDVLKRLMDEVQYEQKHEGDEREDPDNDTDNATEDDREPAWDFLPAAPSKELETPPDTSASMTGDGDLAARLANLSLPSVPTTLKPSSSQTKAGASAKKFTDEEIDSWCIICSDDATLSCVGCDGDLYCTNCWLEGHRGEDAGYDEKTHKAVRYVKGGGKKKQKAKRMMMGA